MDHSRALTPREKASLSSASAARCQHQPVPELLLLNEGRIPRHGVFRVRTRGEGSALRARGLSPALLLSLFNASAHHSTLQLLPGAHTLFVGQAATATRSSSTSPKAGHGNDPIHHLRAPTSTLERDHSAQAKKRLFRAVLNFVEQPQCCLFPTLLQVVHAPVSSVPIPSLS